VTVALGAAAVPCAAGDPGTAPSKAKTALTRLSPATRQLLTGTATPAVSAQTKDPGTSAPSSPHSFFHSPRGVVTLVLMGAAGGFTFYSAHHDRIPVKSPVR
jgi:hypothetical protein